MLAAVIVFVGTPVQAQYGLVRKVESPTKFSLGSFGETIAWVDETSFLVGASGEQSAYLFGIDGNLRLIIPNPDPTKWAGFGWQVAAIGDKLAVAAWPNLAAEKGAVFIYNTDGQLLTTLSDSTRSFGFSMTSAGSTLLVSSYLNSTDGEKAGKVFRYDENGTL